MTLSSRVSEMNHGVVEANKHMERWPRLVPSKLGQASRGRPYADHTCPHSGSCLSRTVDT
jgi:hypothetical protein